MGKHCHETLLQNAMKKRRKIFVIETPGVEGNTNFNRALRLMKVIYGQRD